MMSLKNKRPPARVAEIIRELLTLKELDKNQKKKRASKWEYGTLVMLALHKLNGGSLVIRQTDLGVLVSMSGNDLWLLYNKCNVKGGPKFTVIETPFNQSITMTKGSTRWLETLIKKQMECMSK